MATLTETAYYTRNAVKFGTIGLILLLVLKISWGVFSSYWKKIHPPPPPPPTVAFKKLPPINFPAKKDLPSLVYKLETIEGSIPSLPTIAKVYISVKPEAKFLSWEKIKEMAGRLGFTNEPTMLTDKIYRFSSNNNPPITLDVDKISGSFKLSYNFAGDPSIFAEKKLPNNEQAIAEAKSFLQGAGLLEEDITAGEGKVTYLRYQAPDLVPAISLSEADFVKVGLSRQPLDNLPIVGEDPLNPYLSFIFSGARTREKRLIEVNYRYNKIDREKWATYPLKTASNAWQQLQAGKGFVACLGNNPDGQITIRKIYLAYYDSPEPQNFLQPIFVFEGDKDFFAFLPAIEEKWQE